MSKPAHEPTFFRPAFGLIAIGQSRIGHLMSGGLLLLLFGLTLLLSGLIVTGGLTALYSYPHFLGGFFILAACYLIVRLLQLCFNYYYFYGLDVITKSSDASVGWVYETALLYHQGEADLTAAWLRSDFGSMTLLRLGVEPAAWENWLAGSRTPLAATAISLAGVPQITLAVVTEALYQADTDFANWLTDQGIPEATFTAAADWVYHDHLKVKRAQYWWSRDNLGRTPGIGHDFAYGVTHHLAQFTSPLQTATIYRNRSDVEPATEHYREQVETILARGRGSNVLLVGAAGVGKVDILVALQERMRAGKALSTINTKHFVMLDSERLIATHGEDRAKLEQALLKIFNEATHAGNIILVFHDLPAFIASLAGSDIAIDALLEPYLASPTLQIVATATPTEFHTDIERNGAFLRQFQTVMIESPQTTDIYQLIEDLARRHEADRAITFTIQGITAVIESAERYVVHGVMPDKAISLLDEVITAVPTGTLITEAEVNAFVAHKTGAPVGPVGAEERKQLLNLETILHERIIGQAAAITAITGVMQRSRTNLAASDKPLGTLLFLGPTGVGKTETAKALAHTFFRSEDAMLRLDMSEFSHESDVARLIGGADQTGLLATRLQEKPYCVVLLDEFEKAHQVVHDLFLQIFDEGKFTDGQGTVINARNTIMIATSNAGSAAIRDWVEAGANLQERKADLIDQVIGAQTYRPELINRFDEVVLYAPLSRSEQSDVARLLLEDLAKRIETQGYTLKVTEELTEFVAEEGYQPEFGARPMRRVIQTVIEKKIAEKILAASIKAGDTITLTAADLVV